jgi:DNA repair ATPase RecN
MGYNKLTSGKKILSEVSDARKTLNANGSRKKKVEELENAQTILRARKKHAETDSSLGAKITEAENDVKNATEALKKYDEE